MWATCSQKSAPLTALQILSNSCQRSCDQSRRLQERQQQRHSTLHTLWMMLRSSFLKTPFPWRLRNQAWRRHAQTALFVSSQDRRSKEKPCVFIRQDRAAKGVFAPFSLTSAGKSTSSTREASSCCVHPAGRALPATSTKGAKSSWVDTKWPQHCIWKGTHTWTRTDRLSITAQSGRWAKLLSFFPVFLYI